MSDLEVCWAILLLSYLLKFYSRAIRNRGKYFKEHRDPERTKTQKVATVDRQDLSNKEHKLGKAYGTEYEIKKDSKTKSAGKVF